MRCYRIRPPQQNRSRATHERLVKAIEVLLTEREFHAITVEQIAARAHTSVGTFYKHFPRKRDLLPLLVEREQAASETDEMNAEFHRRGRASLAKRVTWLVRFVASTTMRRRNVLRACIAARQSGDLTLTSDQIARTREQLRRAHEWLLECSDEIAHDEPTTAIRVGVYLSLQSLQSALLFEQLPADLPPDALASEAERMLMSYLTDHRKAIGRK